MSKGGCCHHFDPIYLHKDYGEKVRELHGICIYCKKVVRAETLMKRLNELIRGLHDIRKMAVEQAQDEKLWFDESYLEEALRNLHSIIEEVSDGRS